MGNETEEESSTTSEEKTPRRSKRLQENKKRKEMIKNNTTNKDKDEPIENKDIENKKRKIISPELFFFFIPQPQQPQQKNNENESSNNSSSEEDEDGVFFGPFLPENKIIETVKFNKIFETLDELIILGEKYDPGICYICNIDIKKLNNIVEPLKELNNMIGLTKFKKNIIDQLVYILTTDFTNNSEIPMLHSCIYGSPGTGKTSVCEILGRIYAECGILSNGDLKTAKREDFVGEFLGQTSVKTKKLLESCKGKVLFIDEVYSFGSSKSTSKDMFAKEAIDCLNVFLSENYKDFICIIAGYKEEVESCFFSINEGLKRRFTNTYTIDSYSPKEMCQIFLKFVKDEDWNTELEFQKLEKFFSENKDSFPYYGGDIKTLLDKCKIIHSRKIIMLDKSLWRVLNDEDIEEGFKLYLEERQVKKDENLSHLHMYL